MLRFFETGHWSVFQKMAAWAGKQPPSAAKQAAEKRRTANEFMGGALAGVKPSFILRCLRHESTRALLQSFLLNGFFRSL